MFVMMRGELLKIMISVCDLCSARFVKYQPINTVVYNSHGRTVQCNGNFGTFNLPDGPYVVRRLHFHGSHGLERANENRMDWVEIDRNR